MASTRENIIAWAVSKLGTKEGSAAHKAIVKRYNEQSPLPRGVKATNDMAWCAMFCSVAALENNAADIIPTEVSVGYMVQGAQKKGIWQERDEYEPQPGDLICYDWQDSGVGDNTGWPDHVGIVEKVTAKTIYTIEGNVSDQVARRNIKVNGKNIRGFICPKYEAGSTAQPVAPQNKPQSAPAVTADIVYTVKKGDTLSAISKAYGVTVDQLVEWNNIKNRNLIRVGQKLTIKAAAKEETPAPVVYIVNTQLDALNVRRTPGGQIIGTLPKGSRIQVAEIVNKWAKLAGREGYVSADYLKKA